LNVHGVNDVEKIEKHTAEPTTFEVDIDVEFKRYKIARN
jgi:hypothetical protein